jgi:threonyl-tRNA synthetase
VHDKVGYIAVQTCRRAFDWATGYSSEMNERKWLARMIYLETVAGVPGMVAGMMRHMRSLRTMKRDRWAWMCLYS